jgi:hypothetical protein
VDLKNSWKAFATPHLAHSWILIDFLNYRINPTHYSIRTRAEYDHDHPRSRAIKGSNDSRQNWTELDRRSHNYDLKAVDPLPKFSVANRSGIRSIRIWQTGMTSNENNYLVLKCIEFFDALLPSDQLTESRDFSPTPSSHRDLLESLP